MNSAKTFLESALAAYFAQNNEPLIDESFSMAFDSAIAYQSAHPDATYQEAAIAGHYRVSDPTGYAARYPLAAAAEKAEQANCAAYGMLQNFQKEQNENEGGNFIANIVQNEEGEFGIDILDSYSQGIALVLTKDGRFSAFPCGG